MIVYVHACECNDLIVPWSVVNECVRAWKGMLLLYDFERKLRLMHTLFSSFHLPLKMRNV